MAYWDTLGWVSFSQKGEKGKIDLAEK